MGLMQFLSVGRSLGRVNDAPSRYKMTQQNLLPKFGSARRDGMESGQSAPAAPENVRALHGVAAAPAATNSSQPVATNQPRKVGLMHRILRTLQFGKSMHASTVDETTEQTVPARPTSPERAFPRGRWTLLTEASFFRNPFAKGSTRKDPQPPVQTELLLDGIKPVRNDLSDCDLEVVAGTASSIQIDGSREEQSTSGHQADPARLPETEVAWERIKAQFLGAGKP